MKVKTAGYAYYNGECECLKAERVTTPFGVVNLHSTTELHPHILLIFNFLNILYQIKQFSNNVFDNVSINYLPLCHFRIQTKANVSPTMRIPASGITVNSLSKKILLFVSDERSTTSNRIK